MRVRRDVSALPHRTGSDAWKLIVELVTASGSKDAEVLSAATALMASVIADENPSTAPFVLEGCGPQLRVYCLYGEKAIEAGSDINSLSWNPTAGDWTMRVPCDADNLSWVTDALKKVSSRFKVYDLADPDADEPEQQAVLKTQSASLAVDWNAKD